MMRGWGPGLLALLFLIMSVLGAALPRSGSGSAAGLLPFSPFNFLSGQISPAARTPESGVEAVVASSARPVGHGKREREGGGDDPTLLPTLLVVAIALFYALPLSGSDVARALRIGLTPEGRHREAGRCPTGPPAFAG